MIIDFYKATTRLCLTSSTLIANILGTRILRVSWKKELKLGHGGDIRMLKAAKLY